MVWTTLYDKVEDLQIFQHAKKCVLPYQLQAALGKDQLEYLTKLQVESRASIVRLSGIICIIGIATREVHQLEELIESGMNVACLDFSNGDREFHEEILEHIKTASKNVDKRLGMRCPISVAVMLKGRRIRCFPLGASCIEITLHEEDIVKVSGDLDYVTKEKHQETLYVNYSNIHNVVQIGGDIIIGQKPVELLCVQIVETVIYCKVVKGGVVRSGRRVLLPAASVDFPPLTGKDQQALTFVKENNIDIVIARCIPNKAAVDQIRQYLEYRGCNTTICSGIENLEGFKNADEIIDASDGILLNRGDIANEIDLPKVFIPQKSVIARCNKVGKPVICMKHLLRSMINHPRPTCAECCDLSNVILDGSDCILFHHETTIGIFPSLCVQYAAKICKQAEAAVWQRQLIHDLSDNIVTPTLIIDALSSAAVGISLRLLAPAIIVVSTSIKSAKVLTQHRPKCPIIMVTRNAQKARLAHLFRGIIPIIYEGDREYKWSDDVQMRVFCGINFGRKKGFIQPGDPIVVMTSSSQGSGFTDKLKIVHASKQVSHGGKECTC